MTIPRTRLWRRAALLILVGASAFAVVGHANASSAAANLVPVADLESDPAAFMYTSGPGVFSWATDASHSPTHALKLVSGPLGGLVALDDEGERDSGRGGQEL